MWEEENPSPFNKKQNEMTLITYIINEEGEKVFFTPEPQEVRDIENQIKWGEKKGIVSLIKDIRTSVTYWEIQ